jgi:two-component system, OmpR family, response regulator
VTSAPTLRSPRLLLVDDEAEIRDLLSRYFARQGFTVQAVEDGRQLREAFGDLAAGSPADVVLLDLGLPGEDGLDLARWLRSRWGGPLLMVTGRGDAVDRVVGLELGADDYVTKPFDLRELLARVRSVLRRTTAAVPAMPVAPAPAAPPPAVAAGDHQPVYRFDGWRLDLATRQLCDPAGVPVALTAGELSLLAELLAHAPRIRTRDQLMNALHGRESGPFDRAIDMQVGRLRRKLARDPAVAQRIQSVRGAGYAFSGRVQRDDC